MTRAAAARIVRVSALFGLRRWAYRRIYLRCDGWREFADRVRALHRWRCSSCKRMHRLDVHHLHYDTLGHEDADYGDVAPLCRSCHRRWEGR